MCDILDKYDIKSNSWRACKVSDLSANTIYRIGRDNSKVYVSVGDKSIDSHYTHLETPVPSIETIVAYAILNAAYSKGSYATVATINTYVKEDMLMMDDMEVDQIKHKLDSTENDCAIMLSVLFELSCSVIANR